MVVSEHVPEKNWWIFENVWKTDYINCYKFCKILFFFRIRQGMVGSTRYHNLTGLKVFYKSYYNHIRVNIGWKNHVFRAFFTDFRKIGLHLTRFRLISWGQAYHATYRWKGNFKRNILAVFIFLKNLYFSRKPVKTEIWLTLGGSLRFPVRGQGVVNFFWVFREPKWIHLWNETLYHN